MDIQTHINLCDNLSKAVSEEQQQEPDYWQQYGQYQFTDEELEAIVARPSTPSPVMTERERILVRRAMFGAFAFLAAIIYELLSM